MKRFITIILPVVFLVSSVGALGRGTAQAASTTKPESMPAMAWVSHAGIAYGPEVNVRSAASLKARIVGTLPFGSPLTIYARVKGDAVEKGNAIWYRVSPAGQPAGYAYSGNIAPSTYSVPSKGQVILVSLSNQWLVAFDNGLRVLDTPVTTGRPELPTPTGTYTIKAKYRAYQFISPWPPASPWYYPPSMTNYAMPFTNDGYFIHDAPWRVQYGPGTNLPHNDPSDPNGSHGCVNVPLPAQKSLFNWVKVGAKVIITQ